MTGEISAPAILTNVQENIKKFKSKLRQVKNAIRAISIMQSLRKQHWYYPHITHTRNIAQNGMDGIGIWNPTMRIINNESEWAERDRWYPGDLSFAEASEPVNLWLDGAEEEEQKNCQSTRQSHF